MSGPKHTMALLLATLLLRAASPVFGDDPAQGLAAAEEQAMRAAVARVAPSVVRIETVGGLERVGEVLVGTGPTTGIVLTADGYIVSSSFNFVQQPASILVSLADGTRLPAQRVATDHSRMLTLLKVEPPTPLEVPEAVAEDEMSVGAWALAVGRTYAADQPNVSVGIVSALGRMSGRAIQTDAKISPANYGGALIDVRGRILGVLVPLSPQGNDEIAGVEWYDSGIGFAIPLAHVQRMLPRWQQGEDLRPGILGITLTEKGPLASPVTIATCRPNSPAAAAGLKPGDRIVEVAGAAVSRQGELYRQLQPLYSGERTTIAVERDGARQSFEVELVAELAPYEHPYLGILPQRLASRDDAVANQGVAIRQVLADTPAAKAGLAADDWITSVGDTAVADRDALLAELARHQPGDTVKLTVRRATETLTLEVQLAAQADHVTAEVAAQAPSTMPDPTPEADRPASGRQTIKLPDFPQEALLYVPANYRTNRWHGLVFWFDGREPIDRDELLRHWQPLCEEQGLLFVAPQPMNAGRWAMPDLLFSRALVAKLEQLYRIDRARTVAIGLQTGGTLAYVLGLRHREAFGGVVAIDTVLEQKPPENEPVFRLNVLAVVPEQSTSVGRIAESLDALRQRKYPVASMPQPDSAHAPTGEELTAIVRWIDLLDRI